MSDIIPDWMASGALSALPREAVWFTLIVLLLAFLAFSIFQNSPSLPAINYDKKEWTYTKAKQNFRGNAKKLINQGLKKFGGAFTLITDNGPFIILSADYLEAVEREPKLSFMEFITKENLASYDSFKQTRAQPAGLYEEACMKGLTRNLSKYTNVLSDVMTECLDESWGRSTEWHEVDQRADLLNWVARLSARVFNGEELSKNKEWLRISIEFTVNFFGGITVVKAYPGPLRWFAEKTLPICRNVRRDYNQAGKILAPVFKQRDAEIAAAKRENREPNLPDDSIEWFRKAARGRPYGELDVQLGISMAAIHTTSDLLGQTIFNLCAHPELIEPLREEAIVTLKKHGWEKTGLAEMNLLDSVFKETQRMKPISMTHMHRLATANVELPNGIKIHKGDRIAFSSDRMWDPEVYSDPETFDGYRYVKRREIPEYKYNSLLISTSNDHTAFSWGKHACPGRFFAAQEVKIAMVHILLKYDFRLEDPGSAGWFEVGLGMFTNPMVKISVRRRKEELDLGNCGFKN